MNLEWADGTVDVACPVCGRSEDQHLLATTEMPWSEGPVGVARCVGCDAIVMTDVMPPTAYTEGDWDWYVEHIAGIEAIAGMLVRVGAPTGARMLDVGCGYGFGLDLGRFLFGWQGIGLDPSIAAERGRADLGLDIRPGMLDDAFEADVRFDVLFASEVLEHVPDPRAFLASAHSRLADDGIAMLTTPDAAVVRPETPETVLYPALSVGNHEFLVDADGLRRLLRDAGFVAHVTEDGTTLHALAARSEHALASARSDGVVAIEDLVDYCEDRAGAASPDSALAVGMAARQLKFSVNESLFDRAAGHLPVLHRAFEARYGVDLGRPETSLALEEPPTVLVVVHYFLGILNLLHFREPDLAARHFATAAGVAKSYYDRVGEYRDPETPRLEQAALGHRALALVHVRPREARRALDDLEPALARGAGTAGEIDRFRQMVDEWIAGRAWPQRARRRLRSLLQVDR